MYENPYGTQRPQAPNPYTGQVLRQRLRAGFGGPVGAPVGAGLGAGVGMGGGMHGATMRGGPAPAPRAARPEGPTGGGGGNGGGGNGGGGGRPNMGQIQRRTARTLFGIGQNAAPMYQSALFDLFNQSLNPDGIEDQVAPVLANISQQQGLAEGSLDRALGARGLSDSSAMASGLGALQSQGATARASALSGARQQAQARQDALKQMLMQSLGGALGMGVQGAGIAGNAQQLALQRMLAEQQNDFGFGDVLGGIGGLAGLAFQGGWQPFGRK